MQNQFILTPLFMDEPRPEMRTLAQPDWEINSPNVRGNDIMTRLSSIHKPLSDRVSRAAAAGKRPVSVGGDCCTAIAVLAGLQRAGIDPVLVWLDAHGDFNTFETSPSGYIFGMPLAMMCGVGDQRLMRATSARPMPARDVYFFDGRDLDPGERDLVVQHKINWLRDLNKIIVSLPPHRPIYVHFDTDVLDPSDSPAMMYLVPGGPSLNSMVDLAHGLAHTGRIVAISMTTWTLGKEPNRDDDKRSETACMSVLNALL
jgi:arginase